jgi:hypothetical protein
MEIKEKLSEFDYLSVDKKVDKIIKISANYLIAPLDYLEKEIKKAYIYAREAHE